MGSARRDLDLRCRTANLVKKILDRLLGCAHDRLDPCSLDRASGVCGVSAGAGGSERAHPRDHVRCSAGL